MSLKDGLLPFATLRHFSEKESKPLLYILHSWLDFKFILLSNALVIKSVSMMLEIQYFYWKFILFKTVLVGYINCGCNCH